MPVAPISPTAVRLITLPALIGLVLLLQPYDGSTTANDLPTLVSEDVTAAILSLTNAERVARGLAPLEEDAQIRAVATVRALLLAAVGDLDHAGPAGATATNLLHRGGLLTNVVGENLGRCAGATSDQAARLIQAAWMASADHRRNILDPRFRRVGIAAATAGDAVYFVVLFVD